MKDVVSVKINPGPQGHAAEMLLWFGNSAGLIGSLSNSKMIARDGVTVLDDPTTMGQEWQVQDRCVSSVKPFGLCETNCLNTSTVSSPFVCFNAANPNCFK